MIASRFIRSSKERNSYKSWPSANSATRTAPFHIPWMRIGAIKFLLLMYEQANKTPKAVNSGKSLIDKCARPNATELPAIAKGIGKNEVKEANKNPRKTNSSKIGAKIEVTLKSPAKVGKSGLMIFTTSSTVLAPSSCKVEMSQGARKVVLPQESSSFMVSKRYGKQIENWGQLLAQSLQARMWFEKAVSSEAKS